MVFFLGRIEPGLFLQKNGKENNFLINKVLSTLVKEGHLVTVNQLQFSGQSYIFQQAWLGDSDIFFEWKVTKYYNKVAQLITVDNSGRVSQWQGFNINSNVSLFKTAMNEI